MTPSQKLTCLKDYLYAKKRQMYRLEDIFAKLGDEEAKNNYLHEAYAYEVVINLLEVDDQEFLNRLKDLKESEDKND